MMQSIPARRWFAGLSLAIGLAASSGLVAKEATKDLVQQGDAVCTRCHDETESFPVLSIGKTRHGVTADTRTPTCVSCHGASETHINKPEGVRERPKPTVNFTSYGKVATAGRQPQNATSIEGQNQACLTCHQGSKFTHWQTSAHGVRDTACTSCHMMHVQHDKVQDRLAQPEVCFTCHKEKRAEISKPSRHPTLEGKVICSDCHASHGSAGPKLMARDSVVETCYTCHMEKRGPFIWSHQPVTEDCSICHNPHGSTVSPLLKVRPPFLCQQCHEPTGHRGAIPVVGTGNATSGGGVTMGRACVNCHTNIHGGNNPSSEGNSRTMRR